MSFPLQGSVSASGDITPDSVTTAYVDLDDGSFQSRVMQGAGADGRVQIRNQAEIAGSGRLLVGEVQSDASNPNFWLLSSGLRFSNVGQSAWSSGPSAAGTPDTFINRQAAGHGGVGATSGNADGIWEAATLLAGDGTAGAPAYSFASDPDTGAYLPEVGVLGVAGGGVPGYTAAAGYTGHRQTSDAATADTIVTAQDAYSQASTNLTGSDLVLAGGIGRRIYTVVDYTLGGTDTATVTVNGSATVLTEGTEFTAETDNNTTATNLAAAIDAVDGVSATAVAAVVHVTPDPGTYSLSVATGDATAWTVTQSADGRVSAPGSGANSVALGADANASGAQSTALGYSADAVNTEATAVGHNALAGSSADTALGANANASGSSSLALGRNAAASTVSTIAVGAQASATHAGGIAFGVQSATSAANQATFGSTSAPITDFQHGKTANGAHLSTKSNSELLSGLTGASVSTTNLVPAGCRLLFVVCRVTTLIEGATTFDVGDGTDVDRFGAAIALAANTTVDESDATADPGGWSASVQDVTLTANGSNFTAGAVRVTAFYLDPSPPGS